MTPNTSPRDEQPGGDERHEPPWLARLTDERLEPRIDVFVRALGGALSTQEMVGNRSTALADSGRVAFASVRTWPDRVPLDGALAGTDVLATLESFEEWADEHDLALGPAFERRTADWAATGERTEVFVPPAVSLAVSDGSDLLAVFPCTDGERTYDVADGLSVLERRPPATTRSPGATSVGP